MHGADSRLRLIRQVVEIAPDQLRALKREAVLRVAVRMFNERGFHATSLDEVAERLNISKPTLYYYVKNKDEILFECVNIGLRQLQDAIAQEHGRGASAFDKCASSASARSCIALPHHYSQ